ncbi:MAG TPA: HAD-IA family hydrolase [Gemmataceae bacterium]
MSRFRAVVFDFDGTLADSYAAITASVNHVARTYGLPADWTEERIRPRVGYGLPHLMEEIFPGHDPEQSAAIYRRHHPSVLRSGTRLMPDAAATLAELHRRGYRMAVCSNKAVAFTKELLEIFGIRDYFDAVLGPDDVPRPKPAPDMLLEAVRRLGVGPDETLYVGDMTVDVEAARAAGLTVWVIPRGSQDAATLRAAGPDRLLDRLADLTDALPETPGG